MSKIHYFSNKFSKIAKRWALIRGCPWVVFRLGGLNSASLFSAETSDFRGLWCVRTSGIGGWAVWDFCRGV